MAGEFRLEGPERRKLIKELREEFKPLCSQIADFQIEKATQVLKLQIRKLENEMTVEDQKLHARVDREIKSAKDTIRNEVRVLELDLKQSVRSIQRQRARDKADHDRQNEAHIENIKAHAAKLEEHAVNFEAVAIVTSMLIENINMQLESEVADLLDRRMMSLFGVAPQKIGKADVQNTS